MSGPPRPHKKPYKDKLENVKLRQIIPIRESRMRGREARIQTSERRLAYCDNANAPPSNNAPGGRAGQPRKGREKRGGPRGAPRGHGGATDRPRPAGPGTHAPMACPRCGSGGLGTAGANCRDIADVPPPPKATAARLQKPAGGIAKPMRRATATRAGVSAQW